MKPLYTTEGANTKKPYNPITMKEFNNLCEELMGKNIEIGLDKSNDNEIYIGITCQTRGYIEVSSTDFSLCDNPSCTSCRWRERIYKSITL